MRCVGGGGGVLFASKGPEVPVRVTPAAGRQLKAWKNFVRNKLITIFLGLIAVSVPLFGHHGAAAYDTTKKITVKATVTEWFWANPHCFLRFDTTNDKGDVVHWATEASNPSDMVNLGWSKQTFKPGDQVTVTFIPVRNGQRIGRVEQVVLANGKTLSARVVFKEGN